MVHPPKFPVMEYGYNNVLLVKIEGSVWHTIYHHLPIVFQGFVQTPLLINQPMGKNIYDGHMMINGMVLDCTSVPYLWPKKYTRPKAVRVSKKQDMDCIHGIHTRWCPSSLAKLMPITPTSLWFMADITN